VFAHPGFLAGVPVTLWLGFWHKRNLRKEALAKKSSAVRPKPLPSESADRVAAHDR